jgi:integrase
LGVISTASGDKEKNMIPVSTALVPQFTPESISPLADKIAAESAFARYRETLSEQTTRAQDADIVCLTTYLASIHVQVVGDLIDDPHAWQGIRHGLVDGFVQWQLGQGYALSSINRRLATVKRYLGLALRSGAITGDQLLQVREIKAIRHAQADHLDSRRKTTRQEGTKKASAIFLPETQYDALWLQPDTPEGRRNAAMVTIFLGLGLRCGEVLLLKIEHFDMAARTLTFYRPKVHKTQTHQFPFDVSDAMHAALVTYLADRPARGPLWYHIRKDGSAVERVPTQRDIYRAVAHMGSMVGVTGLGPHDLRHTWAERAARAGTPLEALREAGGWASLEMPLRYIKAATIANEGVKLKSA